MPWESPPGGEWTVTCTPSVRVVRSPPSKANATGKNILIDLMKAISVLKFQLSYNLYLKLINKLLY